MDIALASALTVMTLCVLQQATVLFAADWSSSTTRHQLSQWTQGGVTWTDAEWEQARQDLQDAIDLTPRDATLQDAMAQLYALQGQTQWTTGADDSPEVAAYRQAIRYQEASLRLRPTHAMAWANLTTMRYAVNSSPDELFQAWREAARLGPKEIDVENALVAVAADVWALAPEDVRAWVEARRPGFSVRMQTRAE
jgi:tetratricopeptide (TPR) repeat protein